jgi:hypothetical protein
MTGGGVIFIHLFSLITMISGIAMILMSLSYKTANCPQLPTWKLSEWKPWWDQRDWFEPKGFRLITYGTILLSAGAFVSSLYWAIKWCLSGDDMTVYHVLTAATIIGGLALILISYRYKTAKCPRFPIGWLKEWKPWWRRKEWFTPLGLNLNIMGSFIFIIGALLAIEYWLVKWYRG